MIKKPIFAIGAAAVLAFAAGAALAQTPNTSAPSTMSRPEAGATTQGKTASKPEQRFLTEAIQSDLAKVEMGKLAQEKGGTGAVKDFGATLVKDYGEHADKVRQLGESLGVNLPSQPDASQISAHANMGHLSGQRFDLEFTPRMINDHMRDISKYQMEAKRSGPIADMAKETLPMLQKNLQMAQALNRPG
jgi:putative membrane protein